MSKFTLIPLLVVLPCITLAADKYTAADINLNDPIIKFSKESVVAGINKLAREKPACASLDPKSARPDPANGNPDDLAFEVDCGEGSKKVTEHFTMSDVADDVTRAAAKK